MKSLLPILTVVAAIVALWYAAAVPMNAPWARDQAARADVTLTTPELIADTWSQERPRLPAPHQVVADLWGATGALVLEGRAFSKRSLITHAWYTLSATLLGFVIGTAAGVLLAVGIVYNRAMDMAVMPWAIASQTIPILAIAPMIIVVLNSLGIQGIIPKAIISAYLSFFPVVVGMVKGLRAPGRDQLDLLATYSATGGNEFWKLRLPASMPYFFTAMKISIAAALVGTIVGELPTGAVRGLGARMLSGSYYGQTIQIWSALFAAAILAAALVGLIGLVERRILKRMGMQA
ncbi:MAG: ABC transporter permease [Maritimibacter sp.]|nr:ABC transporter permease [Maritimibacter sp.]